MADIENLPRPKNGRYVATLFNAHPDARCLVVVTSTDRRQVRISFPGDDFSLGDGYGYMDGSGGPGSDYQRFHTPGANLDVAPFNRKGYGLMLYCGGSLSAAMLHRESGIYSDQGRSRAAACLWAAMKCESRGTKDQGSVPCKPVKEGCDPIAEEHTGEGEDEEIDVGDFCHPISDRYRDLDEGGYVTSDEVCGSVMASKSSEEEYDTLDASTVLNRNLVVDFAGEGSINSPVPADIAVRTRLVSGEDGDEIPGVEVLLMIGAMFKRRYGPAAAQEFLSRSDVLVMLKEQRGSPRYLRLARVQATRRKAAEAAGQRRITFEGLGQDDPVARLIAKIERNPRPLRPLSARSQRIIETFDQEMP